MSDPLDEAEELPDTEALIDCEIARVEVRPGDVLVVFSEERLLPGHRAIIREDLADHFPGHRVLILDDGKRLAVVSRVEAGHEHPSGRPVEPGGNPAGDAG